MTNHQPQKNRKSSRSNLPISVFVMLEMEESCLMMWKFQLLAYVYGKMILMTKFNFLNFILLL